MKYTMFILTGLIITFTTMYLYNNLTLKNTNKESLKISFLFLLFSLPISLIILVIMFLFLQVSNWILPVAMSNYKIFIISFASVFIILIGEFIIKIFVSNIVSNYFSKKYKDDNLLEMDMLNLIKKQHGKIEFLKLLMMFIISFIIYFILASILDTKNNICITIISSIISSAMYFFMFKSKIHNEVITN